MRVGFDLTYAEKQEGTGTYIRNLVSALAQLPGVEIIPFARPSLAILRRLPRPLARLVNGLFSVVWLQLIVPIQARQRRLDLFHAPAFIVPLFAPCPIVVTVHDAVPLILNQRTNPLWGQYLRTFLGLSIRRAARIVTQSTHAADDLAARLKLPAGVIRPIPLGVTPNFRPLPPQDTALPTELHIAEQFILFVGAGDARKNYTLALRALALLHERGIVTPQLVVSGNPTAEFRALAARANAAGTTQVHFIGYVTEETLVKLYNRAQALIFPSRYEGFGLPVLEAMACGCPVICSAATSLREVAGDAAILIDPDDAIALANTLTELLQNHELGPTLAAAGIARAQAFTWALTAARTLAVYREVC